MRKSDKAWYQTLIDTMGKFMYNSIESSRFNRMMKRGLV